MRYFVCCRCTPLFDAQRQQSTILWTGLAPWSVSNLFMRTVIPSLKVVQQPPMVVLVGVTFEIRLESQTDGSRYEIAIDDSVSTTTKKKSIKSGAPVTFQCSFAKPQTDKTIQVRLLSKNGKVVATVNTFPVTATNQKLEIVPKNWTSPWYKDEGGREKSIDLLASLHANTMKYTPQKLCLKPMLYYASSSSGTVAAVVNQDVLRVLSEDLSLGEDGSRLVRLRIEDVSKNHQGQDFQIQLSVADHPEIMPGLSPSITVRSKRNKRFRTSLGSGTAQSTAKKPAHEKSQIHNALCCILKWSDDVASVLHASSNPTAAAFLSQYGYIREQLQFLQTANAEKDSTYKSCETLVPSQHVTPMQSWYEKQRSLDESSICTASKHLSEVSSHAEVPSLSKVSHQRSFTMEAPAFHGGSSSSRGSDDGAKIVDVIVPELLGMPGIEKGMPAFSSGGSCVGLVNKYGSIEKDITEAASVKAYDMLKVCKENNVPGLSRSLHGDRLIRIALERVQWTDSCSSQRAEISRHDEVKSHGKDLENKVEYVTAVMFKSKETGNRLGFPVFCKKKQFLGFLQEGRCQHGAYSLLPPPASFGPKEIDEANSVFHNHSCDAVFSKELLNTIPAMLHHALVFSWRSNR